MADVHHHNTTASQVYFLIYFTKLSSFNIIGHKKRGLICGGQMVNCLTLITEVNLLLVSNVSSFNMLLPTNCTEIHGTTALVSPKWLELVLSFRVCSGKK